MKMYRRDELKFQTSQFPIFESNPTVSEVFQMSNAVEDRTHRVEIEAKEKFESLRITRTGYVNELNRAAPIAISGKGELNSKEKGSDVG
jgi:hypothetical protein